MIRAIVLERRKIPCGIAKTVALRRPVIENGIRRDMPKRSLFWQSTNSVLVYVHRAYDVIERQRTRAVGVIYIKPRQMRILPKYARILSANQSKFGVRVSG